MKIYNQKEALNGKSWAIKLNNDSFGGVQLVAIDSLTGFTECVLIEMFENGKIRTADCAERALESGGYDPFEHNNSFDECGAIVISK